MKAKKKRSRRGSIAVVIVFGMAMAIVMLGMMRVGSAIYASGVRVTKQYADINSMKAICQVSAYRYVTDLMAVYATRNTDLDMPGTTNSVIYREGLKAMQDSLMATVETDTGPAPGMVWKIQDASVALSSAGELNPETQAHLLSMVVGKDHAFSLELEEDMILDYHDTTTYQGIDEARIAIRPIQLKGTLRLKSETVVVHLSLEGAYLYAQKDVGNNPDGTTYNRVSMRITDNGAGRGVYIYRAD